MKFCIQKSALRVIGLFVASTLFCIGVAEPLFAQESASSTATQVAKPEIVTPSKGFLRALNDSFADLFENAAPGVVVVEVTKDREEDSYNPFRNFFFQGPPGMMPPDLSEENTPGFEGSGFLLREDGYILTNNHVVGDATKIRVRLKDGREFDGKVHGRDEKTDIAVVKIEATGLPVLDLADSDKVRVGELVCAIGAPYALDYTLTVGWVSAKGRTGLQSRMGSEVLYEEYIQTDAAINPGNSGGPLLDIDGKVVGMNTLIHGVQRGLGFAIPSNMLKEIGTSLIEHGRVIRPWLGIGIASLKEEAARSQGFFDGLESGVLVLSIISDGPAYASELKPGDVILAINGETVDTATDLQKAVLKRKVTELVTLDVWRRGKKIPIAVKTAEMKPSTRNRLGSAPPPVSSTLPFPVEDEQEPVDLGTDPVMQAPGPPTSSADQSTHHGLQLQALTPALAKSLGVSTGTGLVITEVAEGSPAALARLEREDVVTEIDSKSVSSLEEFEKAVAEGDLQRGVLIYFDRKGVRSFAVLKSASAGPDSSE